MALKDLLFRIKSQFDRSGVTEAEEAFDDLGESAEGAGDSIIGSFGPQAAGAAISAFVVNAAQAASEIQNLSERTGISAETLQRYGQVAKESGGDVEDVADAFREMQLRLSEAQSLASGPAGYALKLRN
ncbi:MAG: hypothetical protein OXG72_09025, partial [Acidobacteria bacterium]|nr:hypothetical protein [Acidobacteriota bacterium]